MLTTIEEVELDGNEPFGKLAGHPFYKRRVVVIFPNGVTYSGKWDGAHRKNRKSRPHLHIYGVGWIGPVPVGTRIRLDE